MSVVNGNTNYKKSSFKSFNDLYNCVAHIYTPDVDTEIVGVVQIIHGMAEYITRYEEFASFLCKKGYVVVGIDHIGHGESINSIDDLGHFGVLDGAKAMVEDAKKLFDITSKEYPNVPYFMFGHSMGSMVLRKFITDHNTSKIKAVIICGTAGSNPLAGIGIFLSKIIKYLKGEKHKSAFIDKMAFGAYNNKYDNPKTKFDWLSRDENEVNKYIEDEKCGYLLTISSMISLLQMMKEINSDETFSAFPKDLPALIISGSMDPVGDYGKGINKVYDSIKPRNINVEEKLYDGARHEILNETNKDEVYEDVLEFLEEIRNQK